MTVTSTERVVVLMSRREKAQLEAKARRVKASVGELVRRSVAAYDPDEAQSVEIEALLAVLEASHREAIAALDDAQRELAETRAQLARGGEGDGAGGQDPRRAEDNDPAQRAGRRRRR
jgi:hypothetical protein